MPSREASLRNLEKAKARWRPPQPWRSVEETRIIIRLVWQWHRYRGPKCSVHQLARQLRVSRPYVQKLVRRFLMEPNRLAEEERAFGPATFEKLRQAQRETRRMAENGWLRPRSILRIQPAPAGICPWELPIDRSTDPVVRDNGQLNYTALYMVHLQMAEEEKKRHRPVRFRSRYAGRY